MRSQAQVYFVDTSRSPKLFDDVHQILMTSQKFISLAMGSQVVTIPYGEIGEIRVRVISDE